MQPGLRNNEFTYHGLIVSCCVCKQYQSLPDILQVMDTWLKVWEQGSVDPSFIDMEVIREW